MPFEDLIMLTDKKMMSPSPQQKQPTSEKKLFSRILSNLGTISRRHEDVGFSRRLESSFRVYYPAADRAISVPFTWESQPGTPKHDDQYFSGGGRSVANLIPPLTPPPSFYASSSKSSPLLEKKTKKKKKAFLTGGSLTSSKLKIFYLRGGKLVVRKRSSSSNMTTSHVAPTDSSSSPSGCYYSSSSLSSSSGSSTSVSVASDSPTKSLARWPRSQSKWMMATSTPSPPNHKAQVSLGHLDVEEEVDAGVTGTASGGGGGGGGGGYFLCFGGSKCIGRSGHTRSKSSGNVKTALFSDYVV